MTDESKAKQPNQKCHQKPRKVAPQLTEEQKADVLAAMKKAEEAAKAEAKRIELFNASVEKMSIKQINGHLRRFSKSPEAGTAMWATVLLIVSENTKTLYKNDKPYSNPNPFAKLACYLR